MIGRIDISVINGRQYIRDERLQEFRAVDNPRDRIPFMDFDASPDLHRVDWPANGPLKVSYLRSPAGSMGIVVTPATDARPHFSDLPFVVRAAARLHYLLHWHQHVRKVRAAASPFMRAAVMNDILYKCALDVALDPQLPEHRRHIVDVRGDIDEFDSRRSGVPPFSQERAAQSIPGEPDYVLNRAVIITERPDGGLRHWVVHRDGGGHTFKNYPLMVRVEARVRFFLSSTPQENGILTYAHDLPPKQQQMVWDEILCRRADQILAWNIHHDKGIADQVRLRGAHDEAERLETTLKSMRRR